jgi:hypothetical protein
MNHIPIVGIPLQITKKHFKSLINNILTYFLHHLHIRWHTHCNM